MDFDKIKHRTWLSWAAVALLVALCAVLAGLQYRWIREVADAESYHLREDLQYRLNLLRRDLNDEVFAACYGYIPANREIQKLGRDLAYLSQYRNRQESGDRVVRRMAIAVPDKLDLVLLFPDATGTHLVPGNWPPEWDAMRKSLIVRLRGGPAPLNQSSTLLEFPRFGTDTRSGPRSVEQEWLLLDLDADHIGHTLLSDMLNRYLGQHGKLEYDAEVVARANPALTIYRSSTDSSRAATWIPDASVDLLEIARPQSAIPGPPSWSADSHPAVLVVEPSNTGTEPGPNRALWTLRVHHHAGSLETIVAKGRRTNDLLAAGLLLLIFTTTYALVRFSRRAQNLAELQMNFVAGVSHELRTPLTVIRTAAYNLRGDLANQPGQVARYGSLISEQAEKLSALVEQVLRYGNARAGRVLRKREPVSVQELIEAGLLAARNAAPTKDVIVEKHIEPDLPLILADRESVQHALQNLFENAMKYGLPGGDWIGISATSTKNGGPPAIEIRVTDHGPGIPTEEREYIFDPFFRGQRPLNDQIHGTGLGLNLVKRIIEAHGGTVAVRDNSGSGAEFIVRLPVAPPTAVSAAAPSQKNEPKNQPKNE
ncbi:MAG TPA: HAMP domain-containing sensor histidine kinase, partial [Verrucomicrobiae bacterium]|nr:HAMP domain-containing sensor histidine kinase [Verrucomicrobiae bacterium]